MSARTARLSRIAAHLGGRSDRELLREFVTDRSPAAFAELVRRHGPLVFGVCRRALRHQQDSEDAFQATFLVLARRAARITTPEKLPGWLHSVAVRTATEIRRMRDQRASRDRQGADGFWNRDLKGAGETVEQHELAAAVDEVLAALPDHYRLPVVLCELRGLSRKQAAAELGIAEGTLSSRLAKARKLLAERLAKRGFAASVTAVSAALATSASANVPDTVAALAVGSWGGAVSASVSAASDTVVKALFASKLNGLVVSGGLMLMLAGGLLFVPGGVGAQPGDKPGAKAKADPAEALVQQLGSKEFAEREAAEKKLKEMGAKAIPAVRAGTKSSVPEIAQRSEKVLAAIRKEDAVRFVKAFLADKEFQQKFDHPIWTRWAKTVGDDRGSRELFAEVLGADGAAVTLARLAESPDDAKTVYPAELERVHALIRPRATAAGKPDSRLSWSTCYSIGEAAYVLYLGSFAGAKSVSPERGGPESADPEIQALESLFHFPWQERGPWVYKSSRPERPENRPLVPAVHALMAAQLTNLKNPAGIIMAFRHDWGEGFTRGKLEVCLPLARAVCRDDKLLDRIKERKMPARVPAQFAKEEHYVEQETIVRSAVWLYLAEAGEVQYLPDIASYQDVSTQVKQFGRSDENGRQYTVLASDLSLAAQLILHGKKPAEFGFLAHLNEEKRPVERSGTAYGFPDDVTRKTAHDKAKAYLKDAPKPEPKKAPEAERLVQQLGSKEFVERETAEKRLKAMGSAALSAVRAGLKSTSPEIIERCERVLAHIRTEVVRKQFAKLVGDDKPARELFDLIRGSERGWQAVVTASEDPSRAAEVYRTRTAELVRVSRGLPPVDENGEPSNPNGPYIHGPPPVPFADVAAWLYLGTLTPGTEKWSLVTHKAWGNQTSSHFEFLPEDDYTSVKQMAKEYTTGSLVAPLKALTVKWLEKRRENDGLRAGLTLALRYDIPEVLPAVRALLTKLDADVQPPNVAAAVAVVAEFGTRDDVELLLPHLTDARVHVSIITELPKGITGNEGYSIADLPGVKKRVCQVRDIAGAAVLKLARRESSTSGFQPWSARKHESGSPKSLSLITGIGFETEDARTAAFERHQVLFVLAPVPKAKPVLQKKRERAPAPSPELQKALSQLDKDFRHGTPEQFAELEKKADEMINQFADSHRMERIWYEVAHVAAQSGIDKQAERVKKYAAKSLDVNRDPLQRATLYSYLASAEEVSNGAFADRRRKAAGWLLTGYLELLAQELPDEKPELPGVERFDVDGPGAAQARAKHAAQMAARVSAQFVHDQIDRRDVLVRQLRDLYKQDAKRAGRDEKGPDELRALAAKRLADDAAVKTLMDRVLK
jgi:RNA polymerase sigma factor (sigma-70 family)